MESAIKYLVEGGKFAMAAKAHQELAEMAENSLPANEPLALEHYQKAADFYDGEGASAGASKCKLKAAELLAKSENLEQAIKMFEEVATAYLTNSTTKFSAKRYFFNAGICHLAQSDSITARKSIERYQDLDVSFGGDRDCKLLLALCDAMDNKDVEAYTTAVRDYDKISRLDHWKTNILLRAKKKIEEDPLL